MLSLPRDLINMVRIIISWVSCGSSSWFFNMKCKKDKNRYSCKLCGSWASVYFLVSLYIVFMPRCSHGTRMMGREEMVSVYGEDLHWEHFQEAVGHVKLHGSKCLLVNWSIKNMDFNQDFLNIPCLTVY